MLRPGKRRRNHRKEEEAVDEVEADDSRIAGWLNVLRHSAAVGAIRHIAWRQSNSR
jgi:hypothetical protein